MENLEIVTDDLFGWFCQVSAVENESLILSQLAIIPQNLYLY